MPSIIDFPYIKYYCFVSLIYIIIYALISLLKGKFTFSNLHKAMYFLLYGISILGLTIGLIAGNSRGNIAGVIVSSVLTLIGGVIAFSFIKSYSNNNNEIVIEQPKIENLILVSLLAFSISLSTIYGLHIGSKLRIINERIDMNNNLWFLKEKLKIEKTIYVLPNDSLMIQIDSL